MRTTRNRFTDNIPSLDAQVLLAHVLAKSRTWVLAHPEAELTAEQQEHLEGSVARLQAGEPLPYVLGHWEFFGLEFKVTPEVLIPRPETELLVELALDWLRSHPVARTAIDIGTGSGCIAISLAAHLPDLHIAATDLSNAALQVAHLNAQKHGVADQINFIQADLLHQLRDESSMLTVQPSAFKLISANLPYIPTETLHGLQVFQHEPTVALDGGVDGLDLIRRLLNQAPAYLAPHGLLLLEIEYRQGQQVLALAQEAFPRAKVEVIKDLSGHDRIIRVEK